MGLSKYSYMFLNWGYNCSYLIWFGVGKRRLRFASFTKTCVVFRPQTARVRATTTNETKETKTKTKKNKIPAEMPNQNQNQNQKNQNPS